MPAQQVQTLLGVLVSFDVRQPLLVPGLEIHQLRNMVFSQMVLLRLIKHHPTVSGPHHLVEFKHI